MEALPLGFVLKKLVSAILLPPLLPLLCIATGLLMLRRRPRVGRSLAWGGVLAIWLTSTPVFVNLVARPLEEVPLLREQDLQSAQAIVILGAGANRYMPEYDGSAPNRLALERLRYGARLARKSELPVILSGEIGPMAESLLIDFGVVPRGFDGESLDTEDNARNTAKLLAGMGVRRVVLVTHAAHMRRAQAEFATTGLGVIPAPTGFMSRQDDGETETKFLDYLPGPTAAYAGWFVAHEWAGLLALKLRQILR